ncbi:DUF5787 family protein [Halobaculum sp. CBA1158]|uniref:DUF5787 family protein n=1 Tax=Halobaculum sp. CBA1158 TaxID=2904243 RepID=UPI001F3A19A4|nr:DUF5787 family protein [Halobaculum sp. CBA1158]UIO99693.1 DUF5787 family protein [Halobaculum sp. CBA1158]
MEFAFELALCSHLERATDWVLARQLGGAVAAPGSRVVDVVGLVPGPGFDDRARITDRAIPGPAIESDAGVAAAVPVLDAIDARPDRARAVADAAVDRGFLAEERRGGKRCVRKTTRYPDDWFGDLIAIENKPDLGRPGDLRRQLRVDASLALFDRVVLATESHVTGAHLNRLPDAVGVWRFRPETGEREVIREADPLAVDDPGVELLAEHPGRADVALVSAAEKARKRRRIAERAYGKGWRTYDFPGCGNCEATADGRPRCAHFDRVVDPASDCGESCPGWTPGDAGDDVGEADATGDAVDAGDAGDAVDPAALRDERTPWVRDPPGVARRQAGLDRFG